MAMIFMDGFDKGDMFEKWDYVSTTADVSTTTRFSTGRSLYIDDDAYNYCGAMKTFTAAGEITVGCALRRQTDDSRPTIMFLSDDAETENVHVCIEGTFGRIVVRRGGYSGTVLATGSTIIGQDWVYIEVQATISNTTGSVEVRLNGNTTPEISLTNVDTKNGGTNDTIDAVLFGRDSVSASTGNGYLDDVYILNSTGTTNNDFLGDVRINTLSPNANGTYSQMTGSDGDQVDNYALVDETPYSTADYVYSSTSGQRDTYGIEDLPAGISNVYAVQNNAMMNKDTAGSASAKTAMYINSSLYYGDDETPFSGARTFCKIYDTNPDTSSAWSTSDVNGAEAGAEIV